MTRAAAIAAAEAYFDEGGFAADLARRVAIPTESQVEERLPVLRAYLADEIAPSLDRLGFHSEIIENPVRGGPMLIAERREEGAATTVFGYGQGLVMAPLSSAVLASVKPVSAGAGSGIYGTTAQIANAAGVAAIGAAFFAVESAQSSRLALLTALALFALSIVTSAAFLTWMRRAP